MRRWIHAGAAAALLWAGCGDNSSSTDAAFAGDAGAPDGRVPVDAAGPDAASEDAGVPRSPFLAFADDAWRRSRDGVTWEPIDGPATRGAAVLDGVVLAAGDGVYRSEDEGNSFVPVSDLLVDALAAGDDRWFALAEGAVLASTDGATWEPAPEHSAASFVAAGGGHVVAVGRRRSTIAADLSGEWTSEVYDRPWNGITYGDGAFVATTDDGRSSTWLVGDGTWHNARLCEDGSPASKAVFGDGIFITRCEAAGTTFASRTGFDWIPVVIEAPAPVAFGDGRYVTAALEHGTDGTHFAPGAGELLPEATVLHLGTNPAQRQRSLTDCGGFICDDFETQALGFPPLHGWDDLRISAARDGAPGTHAVVVDDLAFSGDRSWRIDLPEGQNQGARVFLFGDRDIGGGQRLIDLPVLHGRVMVYMDTTLTRYQIASVSGAVPESNLDGPDRCVSRDDYDPSCPPWSEPGSCEPESCSGDNPACACWPVANYNIGGAGSNGSGSINYFVNEFVADCWKSDDFIYPLDRWFCFQFSLDESQDQVRVFVDGTELEGLRTGIDETGADIRPVGDGCLGGRDADWAVPHFERVALGFDPLKPQPAATVWVDDMALGLEPIPCLSP